MCRIAAAMICATRAASACGNHRVPLVGHLGAPHVERSRSRCLKADAAVRLGLHAMTATPCCSRHARQRRSVVPCGGWQALWAHLGTGRFTREGSRSGSATPLAPLLRHRLGQNATALWNEWPRLAGIAGTMFCQARQRKEEELPEPCGGSPRRWNEIDGPRSEAGPMPKSRATPPARCTEQLVTERRGASSEIKDRGANHLPVSAVP